MHFMILVAQHICSLSPVWTCLFMVAKGFRTLQVRVSSVGATLWLLYGLCVCVYVSRLMAVGMKNASFTKTTCSIAIVLGNTLRQKT